MKDWQQNAMLTEIAVPQLAINLNGGHLLWDHLNNIVVTYGVNAIDGPCDISDTKLAFKSQKRLPRVMK